MATFGFVFNRFNFERSYGFRKRERNLFENKNEKENVKQHSKKYITIEVGRVQFITKIAKIKLHVRNTAKKVKKKIFLASQTRWVNKSTIRGELVLTKTTLCSIHFYALRGILVTDIFFIIIFQP